MELSEKDKTKIILIYRRGKDKAEAKYRFRKIFVTEAEDYNKTLILLAILMQKIQK